MGAPTQPTARPTFVAQDLTRAYSRCDRWPFTGPWSGSRSARRHEADRRRGQPRARPGRLRHEGAGVRRVREGHAPHLLTQGPCRTAGGTEPGRTLTHPALVAQWIEHLTTDQKV